MKNSIWSNVGWTKREIKPTQIKQASEVVEESVDSFPIDERYEDKLMTESTKPAEITEPTVQNTRKSRQQIQRELLESYHKRNQQKVIIESRNY